MRVCEGLALGLALGALSLPQHQAYAAPPHAPSPPPHAALTKAAKPAATADTKKPGDKIVGQTDAPFTVAMPSTAAADAAVRFLVKPFSDASAMRLLAVAWSAATPTQPPPDLVLLSGPALAAGCKAQTLAHLDWTRLNRDRFQPAAITDCGAGAYRETTILAWDAEKLTAPPDWSDFWDVARHPGRRGLQRTARGTLEIALMADGVGAGDIYRTLRTPDGLDRAFRKLDQLKPYLIWWDKPADAAQMLATGKALLAEAPAAAILKLAAPKHHFGLQWNASLSTWASWAVPRGAPNPEAAALALLVASDLARQAEFAAATLEAPASRDALALLPVSPQLQADNAAGLAFDEAFWAENGDKLEARFTAWLPK